jgi:hypothetical protein
MIDEWWLKTPLPQREIEIQKRNLLIVYSIVRNDPNWKTACRESGYSEDEINFMVELGNC